MNRYDSLVGQVFDRNGVRHAIVKCAGATVVAAVWRGGCVERVFVPLSEVLDALDVTEITMTELPKERRAPAP